MCGGSLDVWKLGLVHGSLDWYINGSIDGWGKPGCMEAWIGTWKFRWVDPSLGGGWKFG